MLERARRARSRRHEDPPAREGGGAGPARSASALQGSRPRHDARARAPRRARRKPRACCGAPPTASGARSATPRRTRTSTPSAPSSPACCASTYARWFSDDSADHDDTWAFLDARIENVMQFEKFKARLKPIGEGVAERRRRRCALSLRRKLTRHSRGAAHAVSGDPGTQGPKAANQTNVAS